VRRSSPERLKAWSCGSPPTALVDLDARTLDVLLRADEVAGQAQAEVLDLADRRLLREGVHGVLLRVGRQHPGVVAGQVRRGQLTAQGRRHREVLQVVHRAVAADRHQADLRLAVLVGAQGDGHGQLPR
jgi:hypothetical protein